MFAIVVIAGKQYKVQKGDVLSVDKIEGNVGDALTFDHVLMVIDEKKTEVGTPVVSGTKVKAKIVAQEQGDKLNVRRYKSKVRERRSIGFRAQLTEIEIVAIG
jgi:large subunit ribosomal protein L21